MNKNFDNTIDNNCVLFETTDEGVRLFNQMPEAERCGAVISSMNVDGEIVPAIKIPMDPESVRYFKREQWNAEYDFKIKSRCTISGKNGKSKICPLRRLNPDYKEGSGQPKTLANNCSTCPYGKMFKAFHNTINFSTLTTQNEIGEDLEYEAPTPDKYYFADDYMKLLSGFVSYLKKNYPQYATHADLAFILGHEYTVTEAAVMMDKHEQTLYSWRKQIRPIFTEYMENRIQP